VVTPSPEEKVMLPDRRAHATLPVSDLETARIFYEQTLGFRPIRENPAAILYGAGDGTAFAIARSGGKSVGSFTQVGFAVDDVEREVRELQARGVVFEEYDMPGLKTTDGVATTPAGRAAWFKDPEGNVLGLIEFGE